jgi:hypothetical protein
MCTTHQNAHNAFALVPAELQLILLSSSSVRDVVRYLVRNANGQKFVAGAHVVVINLPPSISQKHAPKLTLIPKHLSIRIDDQV